MSKYINVDKLLNSLPEDLPYKASVKRVLIQAPSADVVEVTRCKDCVYADCLPSGLFRCRKHSVYSMFRNSILNVRHEDYCSFGERKEQNEG